MFNYTAKSALALSEHIDQSLDRFTFLEGFYGRSWNEDLRFATIFDVLSEAIDRWQRFWIGAELVFNEEDWLRITGDKLSMHRRRWKDGAANTYKRPLLYRHHDPYTLSNGVDERPQDGLITFLDVPLDDDILEVTK